MISTNFVIILPRVGYGPGIPGFGLNYSKVMGEHAHLLGVLKKTDFYLLHNLTFSGQIQTRDPWIRIKVLRSDMRACNLTWHNDENIIEK